MRYPPVWLIPLCLFAAMLLPVSARHARGEPACDHAHVGIVGSDAERAEACRAIQEVTAYFAAIGFTFEPRATIRFKERVVIALFEYESGRPVAGLDVSGFYDAERRLIEVSTASSQFRKGRDPWGIPWGAPAAYSILRHEIAHMAVREILAERYRDRFSKAWLEYIACAVQFALMPVELRDRILAGYASRPSFSFVEEINGLTHGADPDAFAVNAYRHSEENGGPDFIRRLLVEQAGFSTREILWTR
jgi:hypothetical protein